MEKTNIFNNQKVQQNEKETFMEIITDGGSYIKLLYKLADHEDFNKYLKITNEELINKIKSKNIKPPRRLLIPKDELNDFREVNVYPIEEDLLFKLYNEFLIERYDQELYEDLHSDRLTKNTSTAINSLYNQYNPEYNYIKIDISNRLIGIKGERKVNLLKSLEFNDEEISLIFNNRIIIQDSITYEELGVIQGNAMSGFLSNYFLKDFDKEMKNKFPVYIRYEDSFIIGSPKEDIIDSNIMYIESLLNNYKLKLNKEQIKIFNQEPIKFLDCEIKETIKANRKLITNIKDDLRSIMKSINSDKSLSKEQKVITFLSKIYDKYLLDKLENPTKSSNVFFMFDKCNNQEQLQSLDTYVLEKCQYLMTSSNIIRTILKEGYDIKFMENLGFTSLVKLQQYYNMGKYDYFGFLLTLKERMNDIKEEYQLAESIYLNDYLCGRNIPIDNINEEKINVDLRRRRLIYNNQVIWNSTDSKSFKYNERFEAICKQFGKESNFNSIYLYSKLAKTNKSTKGLNDFVGVNKRRIELLKKHIAKDKRIYTYISNIVILGYLCGLVDLNFENTNNTYTYVLRLTNKEELIIPLNKEFYNLTNGHYSVI